MMRSSSTHFLARWARLSLELRISGRRRRSSGKGRNSSKRWVAFNSTTATERVPEATFRSLAEAFPRNAVAWNELAFFAYMRGDRATAELFLERALEIEPDNKDARANLERLRSAGARR